MFIDLDNFKTLNDKLGHDKGDILLTEVASRLKQSVREIDTVARLGGDEFVVLLEGLGREQEQAQDMTQKIGNKILDALNITYDFDGYLHYSTPSIGATLFNQEFEDIAELLRYADSAMYQSKTAGRNKMTMYDSFAS